MRWLLLFAPLWAACGREGSAPQVAGGDPSRGARLLRSYGCGACHIIPGIEGARATVGPPLQDLRRRVFVAGRLPNLPDSLVRWIMTPQLYEPGGAMPNLGVKEAEARDMAAYLYSLH